mgnify:FL=1
MRTLLVINNITEKERKLSLTGLAPKVRKGYELSVISDLLQGAALVAVRTQCTL